MRVIDMSADPRSEQFRYFRTMANPYAAVTANCDISHLREVTQENCWPFFLTVLYCAINAANDVPELRRRICGDQVVEFEHCLSSHTVALENGSYCYCTLDCQKPFAEYLPYAQAEVARAKAEPNLSDGEDAARLFFVSSLPWLSFTAVSLPVPNPPDSNVRITFGKFFEQNERVLLPVNLTVNHALADGIHMARFFQNLDRRIAEL